MRILPFLLLAWPFLEIAAFIVVGSRIGVLATIGLTLLMGFVGAMLLRSQGFGVLRRAQTELDAGRDPGRELANGAMIFIAALLLFIPGFLSDIVGLTLFIPPVRDAVWRMLKSRIKIVTTFTPGFNPGGSTGRRDSQTIDLDPEDYSSGPAGGKPDPASPWRRIEHDDDLPRS